MSSSMLEAFPRLMRFIPRAHVRRANNALLPRQAGARATRIQSGVRVISKAAVTPTGPDVVFRKRPGRTSDIVPSDIREWSEREKAKAPVDGQPKGVLMSEIERAGIAPSHQASQPVAPPISGPHPSGSRSYSTSRTVFSDSDIHSESAKTFMAQVERSLSLGTDNLRQILTVNGMSVDDALTVASIKTVMDPGNTRWHLVAGQLLMGSNDQQAAKHLLYVVQNRKKTDAIYEQALRGAAISMESIQPESAMVLWDKLLKLPSPNQNAHRVAAYTFRLLHDVDIHSNLMDLPHLPLEGVGLPLLEELVEQAVNCAGSSHLLPGIDRVLEHMISAFPLETPKVYHFQLADFYFGQQQFEQSGALYAQLLKRDKSNHDARFGLAMSLLRPNFMNGKIDYGCDIGPMRSAVQQLEVLLGKADSKSQAYRQYLMTYSSAVRDLAVRELAKGNMRAFLERIKLAYTSSQHPEVKQQMAKQVLEAIEGSALSNTFSAEDKVLAKKEALTFLPYLKGDSMYQRFASFVRAFFN